MVARAGSQEAFAPARQDLEEMAGVQLTTKRVERSAEATGKIVQAAAEQDAEAILSGKALPLPEAEPIDKLYVTLDGTGVPMLPRETAGRRGKGAGRPGPDPRGEAGLRVHTDQVGRRWSPGS